MSEKINKLTRAEIVDYGTKTLKDFNYCISNDVPFTHTPLIPINYYLKNVTSDICKKFLQVFNDNISSVEFEKLEFDTIEDLANYFDIKLGGDLYNYRFNPNVGLVKNIDAVQELNNMLNIELANQFNPNVGLENYINETKEQSVKYPIVKSFSEKLKLVNENKETKETKEKEYPKNFIDMMDSMPSKDLKTNLKKTIDSYSTNVFKNIIDRSFNKTLDKDVKDVKENKETPQTPISLKNYTTDKNDGIYGINLGTILKSFEKEVDKTDLKKTIDKVDSKNEDYDMRDLVTILKSINTEQKIDTDIEEPIKESIVFKLSDIIQTNEDKLKLYKFLEYLTKKSISIENENENDKYFTNSKYPLSDMDIDRIYDAIYDYINLGIYTPNLSFNPNPNNIKRLKFAYQYIKSENIVFYDDEDVLNYFNLIVDDGLSIDTSKQIEFGGINEWCNLNENESTEPTKKCMLGVIEDALKEGGIKEGGIKEYVLLNEYSLKDDNLFRLCDIKSMLDSSNITYLDELVSSIDLYNGISGHKSKYKAIDDGCKAIDDDEYIIPNVIEQIKESIIKYYNKYNIISDKLIIIQNLLTTRLYNIDEELLLIDELNNIKSFEDIINVGCALDILVKRSGDLCIKASNIFMDIYGKDKLDEFEKIYNFKMSDYESTTPINMAKNGLYDLDVLNSKTIGLVEEILKFFLNN